MTGAEELLPRGEEPPGANEEAKPPEGSVELVGGVGKGLKDVNPFLRGVEIELTTVRGVIELGTRVSREIEGDVTPIGRRIVPNFIEVGRGLKVTLVSIGTDGDVTRIVGRTVLELTPSPRGMELEGIAPVPKGTEGLLSGKTATSLLVLGNGRKTELEEGGIVIP